MKLIVLIALTPMFFQVISCKPRLIDDQEIVVQDVELTEIVQEEIDAPPPGEAGNKYTMVRINGKYGFQDSAGKVIVESIYDHATWFSEGLSTVRLGKKYGIINEQGKLVLPLQEMELGSVRNGLVRFSLNGKYGFLEKSGKLRINPKFYGAEEFSEGLCVVQNEKGKFGYIDTTGKLKIDYQFQRAFYFFQGQAKVQVNNLYGAIDKSGDFVIKPIHKDTNW